MGPSGPRSNIIYLIDTGYEGRTSSRFTFVHKGILVIMQVYIDVSDQGL